MLHRCFATYTVRGGDCDAKALLLGKHEQAPTLVSYIDVIIC